MNRNQLDFFTKLRAILQQPSSVAKTPPSSGLIEGTDLQETARRLFLSIGCAELAGRVQVRWNPKMRSTAGVAYPAKVLVVLNPRLREFGDAEIDRTLRHELAHLLAHYRVGQRRIAPHGPEWRQACVDLGLVDEPRCHNLPLPRRTLTRQHAYRCPNCDLEIRRVRPIRRKSACLACCRAYNGGRYDERFRLKKMDGTESPPDA